MLEENETYITYLTIVGGREYFIFKVIKDNTIMAFNARYECIVIWTNSIRQQFSKGRILRTNDDSQFAKHAGTVIGNKQATIKTLFEYS